MINSEKSEESISVSIRVSDKLTLGVIARKLDRSLVAQFSVILREWCINHDLDPSTGEPIDAAERDTQVV